MIFGPGDSFLNFFAGLVRRFPVMPLGARGPLPAGVRQRRGRRGGRCLDDESSVGKTWELAGPTVYTLRQLVGMWAI